MKGHVKCIEETKTATIVKKRMKHPFRNSVMFESVSVKEIVCQTFYEKRGTAFFSGH